MSARAVGQIGFSQEGIALAGSQIFAEPTGGMQLNADQWGRGDLSTALLSI